MKYTRRTILASICGTLGALVGCDNKDNRPKKPKLLAAPFRIQNAMWSWWTKPIVLRDFGPSKDKTYLVFTETNGSVGLGVVDHLKQSVSRHIISSDFLPDDHNAGCVVTGNGKVAVFLQGRQIISQPGDKMFYVEFNDGEDPTGLPLKSFDFATPPQRSNYPNAFNAAGNLFVLSRNQQALGSQWHYVLNTWPLTEFSAPRTFFGSSKYTWPYFAIRRSTVDKNVFNFALGWHPFDGKHHDIYFGQIHRNGVIHPWDVKSGGTVVGNMTTGEGLPFNEDSFEKVYECPAGYSTRLFDVSDDSVAFAVFDPANHLADYRYAVRTNTGWANYSVCPGGLPFNGVGIRNYYGGMAISERNKFILSVAREENGQWFAEEHFSTDKGQTWSVLVPSRMTATPGQIFGRPMEEVLSEEAAGTYQGALTSALWTGFYNTNDYTSFSTDVVSMRPPVWKEQK